MKVQSTLLLAALSASALPAAQAAEFEEYGRVIRVQPRVEQVRQPREECRTEYVQAPVQQAQPQRSAGGAILGAIVGGIVGNQVGDQNRQGDGQQYAQYPQEQAVRQCRMVEGYESRTVGYNVTYDYNGRSYTSIMDRDPGQRVRLRVTVEPEQ